MDNKTIFDMATRQRGGRYELKQNSLSNFLISCRKIGLDIIDELKRNNPQLPDIHIDFIDNNSFNACAFKKDNIYFIGINTNTFFILYLFFSYILSFPEILSNIGNSENETAPKNVNLNYIKEPIKPKDKLRQAYSEGLIYFAVQFLICHELGHILNGHIDLIEKWTDIPFISEMVSYDKESKFLDSQTLELDADCYAANIGIKSIIGRYEDKMNLNKDIQPYFNSLEDALFLWTFSIYTLFRFLGNTVYDFNKLENYRHPYPGFRQEYILALIPTIILNTEYSQSFDLEKSVYAVKEFEDAIKFIKEGAVTWDFVNDLHPAPIKCAYTKKGWNHIYQIENNWRNIRPQLECYSKVNLAPVVPLNEEEFMNIPKKFFKVKP